VRIGVISDTHGHLDPQVFTLFEGVDHILHAGDIGYPSLILELEGIAPVTAVLGNNDAGLDFRESEIVELGGRKFFVHHIVNPRSLGETLGKRLARIQPDVVVFGHTHKTFCETVGNTLFFNPGYSGKPRFQLERSVAVLNLAESEIAADFHPLG
jgi:putative phosphoesterase